MNMLKKIATTVMLFGKENAPTICAVGSGVCTVMAVVEGSKAALTASKIVEAHRDGLESEDQTERREETLAVVKEAAPVYAKTAIFTGGSIALALMSNHMHLKKEAALIAAANLTEMAYKNYADKVKEIAGEDVEEKVQEAAAEERAEHAVQAVSKDSLETFEWTGMGEDPFIDAWTKRKFRCSEIAIREAMVKLNYRMQSEMKICLNDLYSEINLDEADSGEYNGWRAEDGIIEPRFKAQRVGDKTYTVLEYSMRPHLVYNDRY